MIKVIAIGRKHEAWLVDGIERYQKRLQKPFNIEWVLLPHSQFEGDRAREEESDRILSRIPANDAVILLDERGNNISSPELSQLLVNATSLTQTVLVIGGAYGVSQQLYDRATTVWSLSRLVFPHQLVRLLLVEQIYRAQAIANNSPYHHS